MRALPGGGREPLWMQRANVLVSARLHARSEERAAGMELHLSHCTLAPRSGLFTGPSHAALRCAVHRPPPHCAMHLPGRVVYS